MARPFLWIRHRNEGESRAPDADFHRAVPGACPKPAYNGCSRQRYVPLPAAVAKQTLPLVLRRVNSASNGRAQFRPLQSARFPAPEANPVANWPFAPGDTTDDSQRTESPEEIFLQVLPRPSN